MTASRVRRQQRSRRNVRMTRLSSPWLETLERRVVLSSVSWINPNGGDWDTASNWSSDAIPTAADDVTISIAVSNPHHARRVERRSGQQRDERRSDRSFRREPLDRGRIDVQRHGDALRRHVERRPDLTDQRRHAGRHGKRRHALGRHPRRHARPGHQRVPRSPSPAA